MSRALPMLVLAGALGAASVLAEPEVRGLWVVRTALVSQQAVDDVVDQAAAGGFNVLLVQVRGRGDAFYRSELVARSVLLARQPQSFDPLARLLARAPARGLAVHAWVNVLLSAHFGSIPPGHVLESHPEWLMVPRATAALALRAAPAALPVLVRRGSSPDVEGYYLSPATPAVSDHLEHVVRELVHAYPVDGLHLDFVRYPGPDFDYSRASLESFRQQRGGRGDLLAVALADPAGFAEHRRRALTELAQRLAGAARQERASLTVSAAVVPDEALAREHRFQDWPAWVAHGIVDAVCPMTYTPDGRLFRAQVEQALARVPPASVWAGVGAYQMSLDQVADRIRAARAMGAAGIVVFSHESFRAADWRRLRELAFSGPRSARAQQTGP